MDRLRIFSCAFIICICVASIGIGAARALPVTTTEESCAAGTSEIAALGHSMSVLPTRNGCTLYVSVSAKGAPLSGGRRPQNGIETFRVKKGALVPVAFLPLADEPAEMALSQDERELFVADNTAGIAQIRVLPAKLKLQRYLLGELHGGFFQLALAPGGHVLYAGAMKIDRITTIPLAHPERMTAVATDHFPVGLALSHDGRSLFVTNAVAVDPAHPAFHRVKCNYVGDRASLTVVRNEGTLEVFDTGALLRGASAPEARVRAGCAPVRVALDEKRHFVWMTARESDVLLGYPIADVLGSKNTVSVLVRTGESPVGLAVDPGSGAIAVGNSARFESIARRQALQVYSEQALIVNRRANAQIHHVGIFPRDIAITQDGATLFVANFGSATVSAIRLRGAARI